MSTPASFSRHPLSAALRVLFLAATLSVSAAYADDYADVSRLMRANQYPDAMAKAEQYLASKPRDPQMRFLKGVIQTETGKAGDAIATFTKITEDYPELPEPYNNLAVLYAGQSQFDKARAALEMAIRTNPSYATAHENLGDVYARLASQAYSKALQLDGGNAAVQPKLALIRTLFSADSKAVQKPAAAAPSPAPVAAAKPAPAAPPAAAPAPAPVVASKPATAAVVTAKPAPVVAAVPDAKPATPAPAAPPARPNTAGAEKSVESAVNAWANAWAAQDMNAYLASYGQNFAPPGNQARSAWENERRARIVGKSTISVKLSDLSVSVQGSKATAKFMQNYNTNTLNLASHKTLELTKVGERWVIVKEFTGS
jgi:tetratricopeptide (TPR) repeat protein